ncbi:mono/diheme cytochrome c family protein [Granulicella aggregans]|uniref:Mono/diheme cytochrome c family protein n=1 Tax=Granulicella aggregans TaxID=474949 RepID=A0A7W7ZJ04_9BACT|nr:mono/diheme cytochrome c family protein [Granulicella aggregans]
MGTVTFCYARSDQNRATTPATSLTTQERIYASAFWPTKGDAGADEFAGEAVCEKCHAGIASLQHRTPMYHAATPATRLALKAPLKFQESTFSYSVEQGSSGSIYSVNSSSTAIAWAFGNAETGQTYLLKGSEGYTESRLSYYTSLGGLDVTVGHSGQVPSSPKAAFGHELTFETAQRCFACHTTGSTLSNVFVPEKAVAGVTCEACHGPGAAHVASAKAAKRTETIAGITNPASMSPADSVDFCGSCHRSFADVAVFMPANLGATAVRFQPFRLERSRCWGKTGDDRITCIACHDPHKPLVRESAAYDRNCLACHSPGKSGSNRQPASSSTSSASAPSCKVATSNCVSCHMPKVQVPQTHASFTDHEIRIVRAGAPR